MGMLRDVQMGRDLAPEFCERFAIRVCRAEFLSQPPKLQAQTLERVRWRVQRYPRSWLARHADAIYGGVTIK